MIPMILYVLAGAGLASIVTGFWLAARPRRRPSWGTQRAAFERITKGGHQ